jgi:hypothetical protein
LVVLLLASAVLPVASLVLLRVSRVLRALASALLRVTLRVFLVSVAAL